MEHTRQIRAFLCIGYVWWSISVSLGFGQIEDLSFGWWTGLESENVLGKTSLGLWSGYFTREWFIGTSFDYAQWEGFSLVEADDYGYREIGTITPQKWTSKAWAKFQTKTIEFGGRGEISELCIGDYQTWEPIGTERGELATRIGQQKLATAARKSPSPFNRNSGFFAVSGSGT